MTSWTVTASDLGAGMYTAFFTLDYVDPNFKLTVSPTAITQDYSVSIDAVFDGWYPADFESVSFTVNIVNVDPGSPAPIVILPSFETDPEDIELTAGGDGLYDLPEIVDGGDFPIIYVPINQDLLINIVDGKLSI